MTEQLPELRNEVSDRDRMCKAILNQYEDKIEKYKKEINNEKRDILKRETTITELQRRVDELEG